MSSNQPSVCAIMLTDNRPEMARQAVECFRRQTYANKFLLGLDSALHATPGLPYGESDSTVVWMPDMAGKTIGELRNAAVWCAVDRYEADIIVHLDDDDHSHPNRIAEQVALLQSSGADVVGYNECLFWKEQELRHGVGSIGPWEERIPGEAWLYTGGPKDAIGSSLCYWRKTWERKPFPATSQGEDAAFLLGLNVSAVHGFGIPLDQMPIEERMNVDQFIGPRMVCRIHPGNTSNAYRPGEMREPEWNRVPDWDEYARGIFA